MNDFKRKCCLLIFFILTQGVEANAQFYKGIFRDKKEESKTLLLPASLLQQLEADMKADIAALSSPKTHQREAGSIGEQNAGMYIQSRMTQEGLLPYKRSFRHPFQYVSGRILTPETRLRIGGQFVSMVEEAFPAPFSASGTVEDFFLKDAQESYGSWILPLYESAQEANDPQFSWQQRAYEKARLAESRFAQALFLYDAYGARNAPKYQKELETEPLPIPVVIITKKGYDKYIASASAMKSFEVTIRYRNEMKEGNNVVGFLDNKAPRTVVIATHYDNIPPKNVSTLDRPDHDEATGTAALLALAKAMKSRPFTKYNYLFVAFSAHEQGHAGSKAFLGEFANPNQQIAYMINLGRLGSLNTEQLTIGGLGSSPFWKGVSQTVDTDIRRKTAVHLVHESDHSSFYSEKIPVLYFTTQESSRPRGFQPIDYSGMKKVVNYLYGLIGYMETQASPIFSYNNPAAADIPSTADEVMTLLGIREDPNYEGIGVMVKSVEDASPANKAKIFPGDILFQLNDDRFEDLEELAKLLKKIEDKEHAKIKIKRGVTVQSLPIRL